jgi:UDP-2,3-diacylglucosamine pyrophosphatase LpxH
LSVTGQFHLQSDWIQNAERNHLLSSSGLDACIVVKKIIERLTAKTTTIGEKILLNIFSIVNSSKSLLSFNLFIGSGQNLIKTNIGDNAITTHKNHILIINNIAKIAIGINKTATKNVFIIAQNNEDIVDVFPGFTSKSCTFKIEEYIVINGHTHHLEVSNKESNFLSALANISQVNDIAP